MLPIDRQHRVEAVFLAAIECADPDARERLLLDRCAGDAHLLAEVRSLLDANDQAHGVLEHRSLVAPASLGLGAVATLQLGGEEPTLPPGSRIGGFTIQRLIGAGGMGVVYVAEQDRPRRTVALKLIRSALGGQSLLRRFEAEADILARLHHPGIAQVYEAGVARVSVAHRSETELRSQVGESAQLEPPQQVPFIAMELIDGPSISEFSETRNLSTNQRLALIASVCEAVHHAHQRGVIHRDLKPSNILIDSSSSSPQPKVLDFGVARVTDADVRVTTLQTGVKQLIGTLPYMSPEQVAGDPGELDTRSDVYSLGVVLYQLLIGRLPHDVSSRSLPEAARIIRDELPSRLSSISKVFRGDIDTIVARALEKDKARRYQSAAELGDDLRRFLTGEPIAAKRDSLGYVLNKRLRRYRAVAAVSVAATIAVAALGAVAIVKAVQARRSAGALSIQLSESLIERGRLMAATDQINLGEAAIWDQLIAHPESRLARWALQDLYSRSPCLATIPSFQASPHDAAFSADGAVCAVANRTPGNVEIWDRDLSHRLYSLATGAERALTVAFDPGSRVVAAGDSNGVVTLWSLDSGEPIAQVQAHVGWVGSLVFSPDGDLLASGGRDSVLHLWNAHTLAPIRDLTGHSDHIMRLAHHPTRPEVASASYDRTVRIWNTSTGQTVHVIEPERNRPSRSAFSIAYSPDGATFVMAGRERAMSFYRADTYAPRASIPIPQSVVSDIAFSGDSSHLYISHESVEVRAASDGSLVRTIVYPDATARAMAVSPAGDRLLTAANRGRVSMWETALNGDEATIDIPIANVYGVCFTRDGRALIAPTQRGGVALHETGRWDHALELESPSPMPLRASDASPDGSWVAGASPDGRIRLWDARTRLLRAEMNPDQTGIAAVCFSPDSSLLAAFSATAMLRIFSVPTMLPTLEKDARGLTEQAAHGAFDLGWSPDGAELALATSGDPRIPLFNPFTGAVRLTNPVHSSHSTVTFDPDGRSLLVAGSQAIAIVDWRSGRITGSLTGHAQEIIGVRFGSPDLLVSASRDRAFRVWEWPRGTPLLSRVIGSSPMSLAVSPDGRYVCCGLQSSGGASGGLQIWDLHYYRRHIAASAEWHVNRQSPALSARARQAVLDALR